ncbi:hypothetical protein [Peribacillus frigoritolerans]|uniref:hypothetical protein n=1 Tax=Peribacillus frigoritolerans TaxID=450367 RepID=UPI00301702BD
MGRPGKWNNPETEQRLQELVYLYRQDTPHKEIRIKDMVEFTVKMNKINPEKFPHTYDRFTWGDYGRVFLDRANANWDIKTYKTDIKDYEFIQIPNYTGLVEKFYHQKEMLIKKLSVCEVSHHNILEKFIESETKRLELKDKVKQLEKDLKRFQDLITEIAHLSKSESLQEKYGLKNIISPNANKANQQSMEQLDNLRGFLNSEKEILKKSETTKEEFPPNNSLLDHWKGLKKKKPKQ